ncbi:MAG TPA: glycosyltransferase family 39 protein [Vicinamibacterales bacterium]|nr:glycosyltransferase family 39 protein [Vicinamibacterales bacterium]
MLSTIASLFAIAYLPGAIIFRLPMADRPKRAALPAEERLFWAVIVSVIVSTTLAFALAGIGVYSLQMLVLCNVGLAATLLLASLGNLRLGRSAPMPGWTSILPAALIAAGIWMYFAVPAAEYVLGGRDPGVYMSEGIQIAQRRSLVITDRVAAAVPAPTRDLFFPFYKDPSYYSVRFMGFHLRDPETGTVTGQFPQGYPVWIAIAYGLDGVTGTRRVIAWWAVLGVLAVYFAGARLIGPVPAAAAAGLLTVHVIQTWYARYPNSEIMTQALLFAALLAHARAHEDEDRFFGPIAASLLGLALFTRFPVVLAIGAACAASLLAHVGGHRARAGFLVTLAAWIGAAGVYYTTQLRPYFGRPIAYVQSLDPSQLLLLAAAGVTVGVLLWAIHRPLVASITRKWLPIGLIAAVTVGGLYALFFREPGGRLAPHDAHAVRVFANLYFTPIAFCLALAGYALVVWRSFWRAPAMILAVTVLAFFFLYKMRIWPEHFWLARRFIPTILPGALIFATAALFAPLWMMPRELRGGKGAIGAVAVAIGTIGVLILGQHYFVASRAIRTHIEYAGVIPQIERLAGRFGEDDLVLVEARAASDLHTLALPLTYIWARNVLVLYSPSPDKPSFVEFLGWARKKYANVYFIGGGGTDLLSRSVRTETVATERFAVPEFESTSYDVYPKHVRRKPFDLTLYRFVDGSGEEGALSIDVGGADDLYLLRFHGKERSEAEKMNFRWTRDRSSLSAPNLKPEHRALILRMSNGGRPRTVTPARVKVFLAEREIGAAEPDGQYRDYTFAIPADLAKELAGRTTAAEVRIESTTWIPRDVIGNADDRQLGVAIDRADIR